MRERQERRRKEFRRVPRRGRKVWNVEVGRGDGGVCCCRKVLSSEREACDDAV